MKMIVETPTMYCTRNNANVGYMYQSNGNVKPQVQHCHLVSTVGDTVAPPSVGAIT